MPPSSPTAPLFLRYAALFRQVLLHVVLVGVWLTTMAGTCTAASLPEASLQEQIRQEQAKAKARRESLSRLTVSERSLNSELAAAETRILSIEAALEKSARSLEALSASDLELQARVEALGAERAVTEDAMTEVLHVLWELHARRLSVKGRDLPDWHVTDREHSWSLELFTTLDQYRETIAKQQKELDEVGERRKALGGEVAARITAQNREKETLLQNRLRYEQGLAALRREKQETEQELAAILTLVQNLNIHLEEAVERMDIAKAKGNLPWPAIGSLKGRYRPSAKPPDRGVTIALGGNVPVKAVHRGRVVHNDVLRGKGRVVILMHGEEYYSLYMFLSESPLRVGQNIERGEIVGTSGFVTSLNGPGLYFELRHHQETVNPEQWLRKL